MNPRRQIKRTNLFVLRIWTKEADAPDLDEEIKWQGQVKRAVDGEAHHFEGLQGLLDWLTNNLEGNSTSGGNKVSSEPSVEDRENERRLR